MPWGLLSAVEDTDINEIGSLPWRSPQGKERGTYIQIEMTKRCLTRGVSKRCKIQKGEESGRTSQRKWSLP